MSDREHLKGLREKMKRRDERHRGKAQGSPNSLRFKVPASHTLGTKPRRPAKVKPVADPPGAPGSRQPPIRTTRPGTPQVSRHTGEPHKHEREIARRKRPGHG